MRERSAHVFSVPLFSAVLLLVVITYGAIRSSAQTPSAAIPLQYFGMHTNNSNEIPTVPFGGLRLWSTQTNWYDLCTGPTNCDFTYLDKWLGQAETHGINEVVYTFGKVPSWASSKPNDTTCKLAAGSCDPPKDINPDGTGTDQMFKDYVTLLANHAGTRIQYWEIWNEPHNAYYWAGTYAQLVRMAKDARTIILKVNPNAKILAPSSWPKWTSGYLSAGGGPTFDIGNIHPYTGTNPPETIVSMIAAYRQTLQAYGQGSKPIWADEGSWGKNTNAPNVSTRPGEVVRYNVLAWSAGAQRYFWYAWDSANWGTLWTKSTGILPTGVAYHQVANWMVGASMPSACKNTGYTWTCGLTRNSGSYQAEVVWNTSGSVNYTAPANFSQYRDVAGNEHTVPANGVVSIGPNPIILETGPSGNTL